MVASAGFWWLVAGRARLLPSRVLERACGSAGASPSQGVLMLLQVLIDALPQGFADTVDHGVDRAGRAADLLCDCLGGLASAVLEVEDAAVAVAELVHADAKALGAVVFLGFELLVDPGEAIDDVTGEDDRPAVLGALGIRDALAGDADKPAEEGLFVVVLVEVGGGLAGDLLHDVLGQVVVRDVGADVAAKGVLGLEPEFGKALHSGIRLCRRIRQSNRPGARMNCWTSKTICYLTLNNAGSAVISHKKELIRRKYVADHVLNASKYC